MFTYVVKLNVPFDFKKIELI